MSELNERRWAVLSERGREDAGLSYREAAGLIERLRAERVHGLCVITNEAAARLPSPKKAGRKSPAGDEDSKPRRRSRRKSAS
ncbi:MAG: hypothetical protein QOJ76_1211 [Acidobacteriota bacterium]|jgi:hypothetical protein|nr:hypothetical protein [Acidobacteriota bacterium]